MQLERPVAGERGLLGRLGIGHGQVEDLGAGGQGAPEGILLGVGDLGDPRPLGRHLGVGLGHQVAADRQQLGQHRLRDAEQPHRADDPAQQPAQHVATGLVARRDAVGDQHQAGPNVVTDHAQSDVVLVVRAVALAGQLARALDRRIDLVDLVEVVHALEQVGDPLQTETGVDVLARQRPDHVEVVLGPDLRQLLLHEHEVPDLQEAILIDDRSAVRAVRRATVDIDLAARPARPGYAHVPVVVQQAAALDPLRRQAGDVLPEHRRLVVGLQHGDPDPVGVEAVAPLVLRAGDQVPGVPDRLSLEVVTEGEVAVHLEKRVMPGGLADLLDVEGANALLHAGGAVPRRRLRAGEVPLEGHHPGIDEQQGGVVVEQWRGGHDLVAAGGEEVEEPAPDLGGSHDREVLRDRRRVG